MCLACYTSHGHHNRLYRSELRSDITVNEVSDKVIQAAQQAMPGITITEAELENPEVYDLEGTLDGNEYEIDVSINGVVVLDIEKESVEEIEEVESEF